jgi:hypothetical protein
MAIVGRIHDHLLSHYGPDSVFIDVGGIPYGADFRQHIKAVLLDVKVLIAVIGPDWLGQRAGSSSRIHEKQDPVRVEIYTALRQRIVIIPVLIDGAKMPAADDLPRDIRELAFRNAIRVDSGIDFRLQVQRLMANIDPMIGVAPAGELATNVVLGGQLLANVPQTAAGSDHTHFLKQTIASSLVPYVLVPVILLCLAHYLLIMKLDVDPVYLRLAALVVPLICGFILCRRLRLGTGAALLLGLGISLLSVAGMTTVVGLIDGHSILPTSKSELQEALEYIVTIVLATVAGNLLARLVNYNVLRLFRLF